ncbi:undecaprenyl-phosphate 4-deoxy-4-formamido-L-arabinose transferase [Catenuloplanes nepalensis]|uniref:Undecaprenyl-phosphate 4-deoxy-4-formamido-L-arabinose transferase n=1 Tax=Catenuloplanes nepalensis TaxID=587533 RepID=A0ABT9MJB2_9ACTN|nr:glycosyltransferase [Catenuloplanes nepalensis]MDP9791510.1 undecaprenyl-phosphate 4-deoxy-4-formamido-L-arabinose transferase [Catenuloplanes nepalensis]
MRISVVVPCYRSAETLPALVAQLSDVLGSLGDPLGGRPAGYEVVLVVDDDGGIDTWATASALAVAHPEVRAIRLARNVGQHAALLAGLRAARHEVIVTMDDDLQHPPAEIPVLLAALTDDVDLVYGLPAAEEHGLLRNAASRLVKAGLAGAMGVRNARLVGAFRAFRAFLVQGLDGVRGPGTAIDVGLSWGTTRVAGVRVRVAPRAAGRSGYTPGRLLRHAADMTFGWSTAPLRLVTYAGFLLGLGGFALVVRLIWAYETGETRIAGFTTIASMVAFSSSAVMIAVGVLGEYIGRIHTTGSGRPGYVIREQVEGTIHAPSR